MGNKFLLNLILRCALCFMAIIYVALILFDSDFYIIDSMLLVIGFGAIFIFLICKRIKDFFEPIYLFSIYYLFVYVAAFFTYYRGFENNPYINSVPFYNDLSYTYTLSLLICVVSYFSVLAGYFVFVKNVRNINIKDINGIQSPLFILIALIFNAIGFFNFLYNVNLLYNGDFISYYKNISMRYYDFSEGVTTLWYNFLYAGSYMLFVRWLQIGKSTVLTFLLVSLSILVFASNGRITDTIFYLTSYLMIFYYNRGFNALNRRYFLVGLSIAFAGVLFYSLRYASSIYYNNLYDFSSNGIIGFLSDFFKLDNLAFILIDKGNIPNFALLMKVVDSWGKDLDYMFGSTLLFPIYGFISADFFGFIPMPAVVAKQEFYEHLPGGNLPVTGMGEMIVNFSIIGFPFGMFLFGALGAFLRNSFIRNESNIYLIFYSSFCFFYLLYPKGEFNNFNLFWMAFPSVIFLLSIYFIRSLDNRVLVNNA